MQSECDRCRGIFSRLLGRARGYSLRRRHNWKEGLDEKVKRRKIEERKRKFERVERGSRHVS